MSKKMGRRTFMKGATSAFLGLATTPLLAAGDSHAKTSTNQAPEYRTLGKTGLKVTAVGMGVMNCSDPSVLLRAYDLGVNFYDTARVYMGGRNESLVGRVFQGKRDKVLIQTKVRMTSSEKKNRESVETSLKSLRTDYVDVLLVHALKTPGEVCSPAVTEFLQAMKKEGKARFTGFSSHTNMASLLNAAAKAGCHDVALVSYNFTHSNKLKEAIALAADSGIGVVAMKTQAGGYKAAKMAGLNPHQAALKYVLTDRNVSTAVPGVKTMEEIDQCAGVMGTAFSRGDSDALHRYDGYLQGRVCTMCGGCVGDCPYGVNHTDVLRVVMYYDGYGSRRLIDEALRDRDLVEQCSQCAECASCSIQCRRGVDIRAQMEWVHRIPV
ncbi:MAG: aldo/keto reductase [Desulfomonilaceae bacterium]|nr:aldo/keto reductase [Desulfomonilaceae bacterium]